MIRPVFRLAALVAGLSSAVPAALAGPQKADREDGWPQVPLAGCIWKVEVGTLAWSGWTGKVIDVQAGSGIVGDDPGPCKAVVDVGQEVSGSTEGARGAVRGSGLSELVLRARTARPHPGDRAFLAEGWLRGAAQVRFLDPDTPVKAELLGGTAIRLRFDGDRWRCRQIAIRAMRGDALAARFFEQDRCEREVWEDLQK